MLHPLCRRLRSVDASGIALADDDRIQSLGWSHLYTVVRSFIDIFTSAIDAAFDGSWLKQR